MKLEEQKAIDNVHADEKSQNWQQQVANAIGNAPNDDKVEEEQA